MYSPGCGEHLSILIGLLISQLVDLSRSASLLGLLLCIPALSEKKPLSCPKKLH